MHIKNTELFVYKTAGTSGIPSVFAWDRAPPPEVIRNLVDAVAGYMAHNAVAVTTVATTSSTANPTGCVRQRVGGSSGGGSGGGGGGGGGAASPYPGQSTQARYVA